LSLGLEEGEVDAMTRPPRPSNQHILTGRVALIIAFDSGLMAIMVLVNYYHCYYIRGLELQYSQTLAFELLACLHLVHAFEARSLTESVFRRDAITSNPALACSFLLSMCFLVGGCYIPGLNGVLELEPLHGLEWGIIAINLVVHIVLIELRKVVMRTVEDYQLAKLRVGQAGAGIPPTAGIVQQEIEMERVQVKEVDEVHQKNAREVAIMEATGDAHYRIQPAVTVE
jgi:Ca2+-transporting ATPase